MIKTFSASVIGTSHINRGMPCHDSHMIRYINDDEGIIVAVSDGMGSAKHAEIGSALAVECITDFISDALKENEDSDDEEKQDLTDILKDGYMEVQKRLVKEAEISEVQPRDLNCTLLVFLAINKHEQYIAQVGDCIAIGQTEDSDTYHIIAEPQKGEYANQTFSVVNEESVENGDYELLEHPLKRIALMSDGLEGMTINAATKDVSKGFFDPFFKAFSQSNFSEERASTSLKTFLSSDRINKKTDDDKTLVFIEFIE